MKAATALHRKLATSPQNPTLCGGCRLRVEIVRMMWQVVFADKRNHELEDNMVWRIAEGMRARVRVRIADARSLATYTTAARGACGGGRAAARRGRTRRW